MQSKDQTLKPIEHIVICGDGLAVHMTVAKLARQLPPAVALTLIRTGDTSGSDLLYGTVTGPGAYAFNLSAGLQEPAVILGSDTSFSWGTKYDHWADGERSWIQTFQLPFPVIDGVLFHQYLAREGVTQLEPFLAPAVAAKAGAFVHPPNDPRQSGQNLLSRAEYGYQFDPASYTALFAACTDKKRVTLLSSKAVEVELVEEGISAIKLTDGERITADLFIDCTGPDALLLSKLAPRLTGTRRIAVACASSPAAQLGPPMRTVSPAAHGWRSDTPLRGRRLRMSVFHPHSADEALRDFADGPDRSCEAILGRRSEAWVGNCVGVGQAAAVVEPLSVAPILLLERDIERLLSLIPVSQDISVERREFVRRAAEDHEHATIFNQALLQTNVKSDAPYWQDVRSDPIADKLVRKLEMFKERGTLVSYDLEPFHPEDWTVLHFGMGRRPARHDRLADRAPADRVRNFLSSMKRDVEKLVGTLPSHATYMDQLTRYLTQNAGNR